jgi:hypothetical protein
VSAAGVETRDNSTCALTATDSVSGTISGTISGGTLNFSFILNAPKGTLNFTGTATLSGAGLSGNFVRDTGGSGSFTVH